MDSRQRLCDGRVVAQERRLDAIRLDELGDQLEEDLVLVPGGVDCDVVRRGIPPKGLDRGVHGDRLADLGAHGRIDRDPSPLTVEVDGALIGLDLAGPVGIGRRQIEVADEGADGLLIAVGLIGLEHREFG